MHVIIVVIFIMLLQTISHQKYSVFGLSTFIY